MQPRTVGAKTQHLIEPQATVPQCVYNMIKAIPGAPVLSVTQDADAVAVPLRSNNLSGAMQFDKWVSRDAFPQGMGKR